MDFDLEHIKPFIFSMFALVFVSYFAMMLKLNLNLYTKFSFWKESESIKFNSMNQVLIKITAFIVVAISILILFLITKSSEMGDKYILLLLATLFIMSISYFLFYRKIRNNILNRILFITSQMSYYFLLICFLAFIIIANV